MVTKKPRKNLSRIIQLSLVVLTLLLFAAHLYPRQTQAISLDELSSSTFEFLSRSSVRQIGANGATLATYEDGVLDEDYTYKQKSADKGCKSMIAYQGATPKEGTGTAHFWRNNYVAGEQRCYFNFEEADTDADIAVVAESVYSNEPSLCGATCSTKPSYDQLLAAFTKAGRHKVVSIKASASGQALSITHYLLEPEGIIVSVDFEKEYQRDPSNRNRFFESNESCADRIILETGYDITDDKRDGGLDTNPCDDNPGTDPVILGQVTDDVRSRYESEKAQDNKSSSNDTSCENRQGVMGWIMCPVVKLMQEALNWVNSQIQALLEIDRRSYTHAQIKEAWENIRNIAYIILIPIMLVMVIGTALDFSFIDAYTVRRALPRFAIAVVFIGLSYYVCVFLIDFFNAVGFGIYGIMTAPFSPSGGGELTFSSLYEGNILTGLVTGAGAIVGIVLILWLFGGTLLLAITLAFLVLLIRQIFIIALLLAAPLAILAWIFPGNDRLWKLWWGTFSKLLMMFPLIMGLIAMGMIFAFILKEGQGGGGLSGPLRSIMIMVAVIIPYALIPLTFRFAGGMFATLTGMINDRSKGLFDRQKQGRANKLERTAGGKMFKGAGGTGVRAGLNTFAAGVMHTNRAGLNPRNMRSNIANATQASQRKLLEKTMAEDQDYAIWKGNDTLNAYASLSNNEGELRDYLEQYGGYTDRAQMERDIRRVESTRRKMGNRAFKQMTFLQATAGGTTYDRGPRHNAVTGQMDAALNWSDAMATAAGNDDADLAYLAAQGKSLAMNAGRIDEGGASFNTIFQGARNIRAGTQTGAQVMNDIHENVVESNGAGIIAHSSMKPYATGNLVGVYQQRLANAFASGNQDQIDRELAIVASVHDELSRTAPNKAELLADELLRWDPTTGAGAPIPGGAGPLPAGYQSVQTYIENRRNVSDVFQSTHREYGAAAAAAAAGGGAPGGGGGPVPGGGPAPPPVVPGGGAGGGISDSRLKRNITYLTDSYNGIRLYRFQYLWDNQVYVGVMAQDLVDTHPYALSKDDYGFYRVDYAALGLEMLTIEEWEAQQIVIR